MIQIKQTMNITKLSLLASTAFVLSSCAVHTGMMTSSASLSNPNFSVVNIMSGSASAHYFLGIGGLNKAGLLAEARKNLFQSSALRKGQVLANLSVDYKTAFYLIYWQTTATITADLVEFNDSNVVSSNVSTDKPEEKPTQSNPALVLKESPNKDVYAYDFKPKEEVMISSFGKFYIGQVEAINSKKAFVSHFLRDGLPATTEKSINSVFKLTDDKEFGKDYKCTVGTKLLVQKPNDTVSGTIIALGKKSFLFKYNKPNGNEKVIEIPYNSDVYKVQN